MENDFSAENSLRLIAETIDRSRRTIAKNSGKPLVLWGCLVALTSLVIWLLWSQTGNPAWNFLWFAMTAVGGVGTYYLSARNSEKIPESEVSRMLGLIWMWFGIFSTGIFILAWVAYFLMTGLKMEGTVHIDLTLIISLMLGMCGSLSGMVLKQKVISVSSLVATALTALVLLMIPDGSPSRILAFVVLGLFALIVPGLILQKKGGC